MGKQFDGQQNQHCISKSVIKMIQRHKRWILLLLFDYFWISCFAFVAHQQKDIYPSATGHPLFSTFVQHEEQQGYPINAILSVEQRKYLEELVKERSEARWNGNYTHADLVRDRILNVLPGDENYQVLVTDIPRKQGGGSTWKLVRIEEPKKILEGQTVLQLAHAALGLAVESSVQANVGRAHTALGRETLQYQSANNDEKLATIVEQVKGRFQHPDFCDDELAGRKSADAAFWFALSGVTNQDIFDTLAEIACREMERFGERSSCRIKDILQILERFSAAGITSPQLEAVTDKCLRYKGLEEEGQLLNFHSDRCQLLIWKFSTKQKKQRAFLDSAMKHWQRQNKVDQKENMQPESISEPAFRMYPWEAMFDDPTRPLVIDIGCGMGVSLLGLCHSGMDDTAKVSEEVLLHSLSKKVSKKVSWKECNFVGVDLGSLGVRYARGLAHRWGLEDRLQFVVDSAEDFIQVVHTYPGPIQLCLIQFPTPYQLKKPDKENNGKQNGGNSQLPASAQDGFMVSKRLLQLTKEALTSTDGKLLLQSNCEDVAIHMKDMACKQVGFTVEKLDQELLKSQVFVPSPKPSRTPQRTIDWIAMGGQRVVGMEWNEWPILHKEGATETEVACELNGTPVHRCLLGSTNKSRVQ